jgi:DNA-binding NtrC family response regulator
MSMDKPVLRILIAEDDPNLGEALVSYLREKRYAVDLARHGGEALNFIRQYDYSLILTDLVMPEADGLEVLRAARQKNPAALVVVMTGHASLTSALKATREGAYDYLRKPFNLQEIEVAVHRDMIAAGPTLCVISCGAIPCRGRWTLPIKATWSAFSACIGKNY